MIVTSIMGRSHRIATQFEKVACCYIAMVATTRNLEWL